MKLLLTSAVLVIVLAADRAAAQEPAGEGASALAAPAPAGAPASASPTDAAEWHALGDVPPPPSSSHVQYPCPTCPAPRAPGTRRQNARIAGFIVGMVALSAAVATALAVSLSRAGGSI